MYDILDKLFDKLGNAFLTSIDMPVKLGVIGGILLLVIFCVCLGLTSASKIAKYTKLLIAGSKKIASMGPITDENVDVVYDEIKKHPDAVSSGWSLFMDQRVGVPSDYFPARNVLSTSEFNGKRTVGKSLFVILGTIVWVLSGLLGYYYCTNVNPNALDVGSVAGIILALEFLIIPIGLFVIFCLSLDIVYGKKIRRLSMAYASFCEILDERVFVAEKEEDAFVSDNLAEINKRVEELIAGRLDEDMIEVITVPKTVDPIGDELPSVSDVLRSMGIEEKNEEPAPAEETPVEEPEKEENPLTPEQVALLDDTLNNEEFVRYALDNEEMIRNLLKKAEEPEEPAPEPAVDFTDMTEEQTFDWVETVLHICDDALYDRNTDPRDLENMGVLLDQALAALDDPTCQAAITDYLGKLADKYFKLIGE